MANPICPGLPTLTAQFTGLDSVDFLWAYCFRLVSLTISSAGVYVDEIDPRRWAFHRLMQLGTEAGGPQCAGCGVLSAESSMPVLGWKTSDGFHIWWPTCRHGRFVLCPACEKDEDLWQCPACGCLEMFT